MAIMSRLKQKLLKLELAKIGYCDAEYNENYNLLYVNKSNENMPIIQDNGNIFYDSEYTHLVFSKIRPIVDHVNVMIATWEKTINEIFSGGFSNDTIKF